MIFIAFPVVAAIVVVTTILVDSIAELINNK
jgi:hypothetical protein